MMYIKGEKEDRGPSELPKTARIQNFVDDWLKQSLGVIGTQFLYEFYSRYTSPSQLRLWSGDHNALRVEWNRTLIELDSSFFSDCNTKVVFLFLI